MMTFFASIHWYLPVAIVVVGAVVFILTNRVGLVAYRSLGLVVVALGVLLGVARWLINTPQEQCEQHTRALILAANSQNWPSFASIMDPATQVKFQGRAPYSDVTGAKNIAMAAQTVAGTIGLERVQTLNLTSEPLNPDSQKLNVAATIVSEDKQNLERPIVTYWDFAWSPTKDGKNFYLSEVRLRQVGPAQ